MVTEIWMSMTGLAARPGIEVEPMWWMRRVVSTRVARRAGRTSAKRAGQVGE